MLNADIAKYFSDAAIRKMVIAGHDLDIAAWTGDQKATREAAVTAGSGTGKLKYRCSSTPDWQGHECCYVQGDPEWVTSLDSSVESELKRYCDCSPCNRMTKMELAG